MTTINRVAALVTIAALALTAACTGSKGKTAAPTSTTTSTAAVTTSTTTGVDQVPTVITVEYAQRVMNSLDKAEGDATRMLYAAKLPTLEWHDRLTGLRAGKAFDEAEADYGRDAAHEFDTYRNPPGDPTTQVLEITDSTPSCLVLRVSRDFGPYFVLPPSDEDLSGVIFLRTKDLARDPRHVNLTAWAITGDGEPVPGADLAHACH